MKIILEKTNFIFFNIGLFFFIFLWDLKLSDFEFRFLILLPFFTLISYWEKFNYKTLKKIFVIPTIISFHLLIVGFFNQYTFGLRDVIGIIFLFIIFAITIINLDNIEKSLSIIIKIFTVFFSLLYIIFFFYSGSVLTPDCYDGWFFKTKFIFVENSHFALISVPIINYYTFLFCENKIHKKNLFDFVFFMIFLIISFINFSTTFLIGLILTQSFFLLKNYSNKKFVITNLILLIISILILSNYKQCIDRSVGSIKNISELIILKKFINKKNNDDNLLSIDEKEKIIREKRIDMNMSVETFIVSLEITYNSILSNPFGVGFNRYQNAHKKFIDEIVKINKNVKKNNIYDGSTNLSKIPTEFGIFGIFFIVLFGFSILIKKNLNQIDYFVISLICIQFLRGVGYFNAGFLLIVIVYFFKINKEKNIFKW